MGKTTEINMTDRIRYLFETRNDFYDRETIPQRDQLYNEAFAEQKDRDRATKTAIAFDRFLSRKKILIKPEDVFAGYAYKYTWNLTVPHKIPTDYDPSRKLPHDSFSIDEETEKCMEHFGLLDDSGELQKLQNFKRGVHNWLYKHNPGGHVIPGHERILSAGLKTLLEEAEAELSKERPAEEKSYIAAMLISAKAVSNYILRYANEAQRLADTALSAGRKAQLRKIAQACRNVAFNKPGSFFEAVQLLWLIHEALITESPPNCISIGRLDVYLDPFYQEDLAHGRITYEEAEEIIDALWIKFSTSEMAYQNVTLGGYDEAGRYIANPVTFMALRATRKFRCDQPLVSLRYAKSIPQALWEEVVALWLTGTGFPPLFNDDVCIAVKEKAGLTHQDAVNYGLVGCVEMTGCGNDYSNTESLRFNIPIIIEFLLNGGVQRLTREVFPLRTYKDLDKIESFEEFYGWFEDELRYYLTLGMENTNRTESLWGAYYPLPFLSFTMRDCVGKGRDVADGGTTYNNSVLNGAGFANAADSLAAIKKVVFEDKRISLGELSAALEANFEGYEELRHILTACPKYGNDDDETDAFVKDIVGIMHRVTGSRKNGRGGVYGVGLYTVQDHARMGEFTGALPDGRLRGVALANAVGPSQGKDTQGPTAVVNSVLKANLEDAGNGMVLDMKFSPSFLRKESNQEALRHLVNSYFGRGGMEIQLNVIDRETLIAAQKDPAKYKDLVVRVSGFSAYFCSLLTGTQNEIIARTEYAGF